MQLTTVNTLSDSTQGSGQRDKLREATRQLVGSVFYGTLLKNMRASSLRGEIGHGGRGEEVFGAQLDGVLAERAGMATRGGLADHLYKHLEHQQKLINQLRQAKEASAVR